jgi:hypothetical protein
MTTFILYHDVLIADKPLILLGLTATNSRKGLVTYRFVRLPARKAGRLIDGTQPFKEHASKALPATLIE